MSGARDSNIRSVVEYSCASIGPSFRSLVDNLRARLNKSVSEVFCARSILSQFHADAAIDSITLHFSTYAALDDGDGLNNYKDAVDPPAYTEVIEV